MAYSTRRVVIIGGGAAGSLAAVHLVAAASAERPVEVRVVERGDVIGPGLAYRTRDPRHLLNNYAGRLSVFDDDPDHLLRWCAHRGIPATPQSFLPRHVYGRYLTSVLTSCRPPAGSRLQRMRAEVVDVVPRGDEYEVVLAGGRSLRAHDVVLALGNPPPRRVQELEVLGTRYAPDPWAPNLLDAVSESDRVLLVGTGLTMVDVAAQIAATHPRTHLVAVSRHGLLPTRHVRRGPRQLGAFRPDLTSLSTTLRDVRRRVAEVEEHGGNWRDVVDSLRPFADEIWADMADEDRERFVRHVARRWEVLRHRMAPDMADMIEDLRSAERLTITSWSNVDPSSFSRVVNCTGPAPVCTPGWNAVVDRLRTRELLRPDLLGLGVDVDATGALIGVDGIASPRLLAVGAARRGTSWEVAAIPDIRKQTARLAAHLLGSDVRRTRALPA